MSVDVKGEGYDRSRENIRGGGCLINYMGRYILLIGRKVRDDLKGILWFSYRDILKEMDVLAVQVITEMLCIFYCLMIAIWNPFVYSCNCTQHPYSTYRSSIKQKHMMKIRY